MRADVELIPYSQSLQKLRDTQRGIEFAAEQAARQASERSYKRGRDVGRTESNRRVVDFILGNGMDFLQISKLTGLTIDEINNLCKDN